MAILSTNQRLINVGDSYSAGNGIDITNNIISVTGDNAPYSAGDNIDIQDHIISGKDWSNDIENASANAYNVTTAWVQDNYANSADMTYISAMVDTKLDTSAWSSVSGDLATESYVIMADNITYDRAKGYVDSKGFATEEFVNENTSGKLDSSSFASVSSDFLTTAFGISESGAWNEATNCVENNSAAWFDNQGDIEVNELVYAQSANWNEISSKLDSTAFDTWQQGQYTNDIAGLNNLIGTKLDASSFEETSGTFYPTSNPSGFITGVDLSNYYTKDETSGKEELSNAFANIPVGDPEVNAYVTSNSASIDESTNLVQSNSSTWNDVTAYQSNSANYITAHQSLEGLMSASLLESADGKWTAYNSIPFKAGDEFPASADEAIITYQTNSGLYLTAHQDISNKLDVSAFSDVSGTFLTGVDLTPYYTTADANTLSSMLSGAIDYVSANAGDEFPVSADEAIQYVQTNSGTIDDTVTSYQTNSGTFLTEPNLEYNAVGEISGYGNSAIAQYGAEKQWLQHDDTLVHAANSAQYALGVNLSAVAQLLGVDETVLLNRSGYTSNVLNETLSDSINNYKRIKILCRRNNYTASTDLDSFNVFEMDTSAISAAKQILSQDSMVSNTFYRYITVFQLSGNNYKELSGCMFNYNTPGMTTLTTANVWLHPTQIIGIGRKQ